MIWAIVIAIVGFILIRFFIALSKDNDDLQGQTADKKFCVVVNMINDAAFAGQGTVTVQNKRMFNLYQDGQNQIISFLYSTGHLTITWKYKYFQKEVVHEKQFSNVRNLSLFEQQKIGEQMIDEMMVVVEKHQKNVIGGI